MGGRDFSQESTITFWDGRASAFWDEEGDHALPKPKKPGFLDHLYLDTDILAKTRFLTRARSLFGDESFLGMGSAIVVGRFWGEAVSLVREGGAITFWGVLGREAIALDIYQIQKRRSPFWN